MSFTGIDSLIFGVEDAGPCKRFYTDWGLSESSDGIFETLDGSRVQVFSNDHPSLPPVVETGEPLREVVFGLTSAGDLQEMRSRLNSGGVSTTDETDNALSCLDPMGLKLTFRISARKKVPAAGALNNTIDEIRRVDTPSPIYDRAHPHHIGHFVLNVPELKVAEKFYGGVLRFHESDRYPERGIFYRCNARGAHHNLFLLQSDDGTWGLNHVAFTVRDVHEVFGGGMYVNRCGWETELGPGRHPISSAFFWYVKSPVGAAMEYFADVDHLTENWKPRSLVSKPEVYTEWAFSSGIDGHTRRENMVE